MKRIITPLALAALLSAPSIAQAEGTGFYVAPKLGFGWLSGYDIEHIYFSGDDADTYKMGSDSIFGGAIAVGYKFKRQGIPVRAELEYAMFSNAKSTGKRRFENQGGWTDVSLDSTLSIKTLFVNGYYDFQNDSAFTPYVGLGVGLSSVGTKLSGQAQLSDGSELSWAPGKKTKTNFAWNLGGGFSYALTKEIDLDLGYRFVWLGKGETKKDYNEHGDYDYVKTKNLTMHQVMFGMRYAF